MHKPDDRRALGVILDSETTMGAPPRVRQLERGSPLFAAGIRAGDILLDVDGIPSQGAIDTAKQLRASCGDVEIIVRRPSADARAQAAQSAVAPSVVCFHLCKADPTSSIETYLGFETRDGETGAWIRRIQSGGVPSGLDVALGDKVISMDDTMLTDALHAESVWREAAVGRVQLLVENAGQRRIASEHVTAPPQPVYNAME